MKKIILASASPRRRELLEQIGMTFEVVASNAEENYTGQKPGKIAEELSYIKGMAVAKAYAGDGIIIGADTLVAIGDESPYGYLGCPESVDRKYEIFGKPKDEEDAISMLKRLQGKTHQVYTGVTIIVKENGWAQPNAFYEKTDVTMFPMSQREIENYVATKEPMDKAGAYGIQGRAAAFIEKIDGDYNNVVGLPVGRLYQLLKECI